MSTEIVVQLTVNLLILGSLYTLVTIGLALIFSIMGIINFAHAQMYMLGAFGLYYLYVEAGLPYAASVVLATLAVAALAVLIERVVVAPLHGQPLRAMIVTLGLLLVIDGTALMLFGAQSKFVRLPLTGEVHVLGAVVPIQKLIVAGTTLVLLAGLLWLLRSTQLGRAVRAVAQDRIGARLQGINVRRINVVGFAGGCALAGLAGALILPITSAVDPGVADPMLAKMFIIVILGGLGSIWGAAAGGFALAAIESFGFQFVGNLNILFTYALVLGVLLVKPTGLMGND